jgi:hypothetical protein
MKVSSHSSCLPGVVKQMINYRGKKQCALFTFIFEIILFETSVSSEMLFSLFSFSEGFRAIVLKSVFTG